MEIELIVGAASGFLGVALLTFYLRRRASPAPRADDEAILQRNATAYRVASALFVGSLFVPVVIYQFGGIGENAAWPAVLGFTLSVAVPVGYLWLRELRGGPGFEELLRYGELKDRYPRKLQIAIFWLWVIFACAVIVLAVAMDPA